MRTTLLALLIPACLPAETGIDHTVISGTITIPPATVNDGRTNDAVAAPQALGPDDTTQLTYRSVVISGTVAEWPSGFGNAEGDVDNFAFAPVADGTFTFTFTFATAPGSGTDTGAPPDADIFELQLVDPATYDAEAGTGVLTSVSTDGSGGDFSFTYDVAANTTYVLRVLPISTDATTEELPYTLVVSGSAPDDTTVLAGAYLGADPTVAENPVGGTNVTGWTYDAATATWTGAWKIMYLRQVVAVPDTDTGDLFEPSPEVTEGPGTVYLRAGTLTTLNAGPAAGALYTTTSVEVKPTGAEMTLDEPLVLDGVAPKVIGVQVAEELPDVSLAEVDPATGVLDTTTLVAQDIGLLSGLGYVDIITGSTTFDPSYEGWNAGNDSDAYAFTVPESVRVRMKVTWPDDTADIDVGIFFDDPDYGFSDLMGYSDPNCMTGADPEVCTSVITLEPEIPYYVVPLGYLGTDEQPYTVELEWMAP